MTSQEARAFNTLLSQMQLQIDLQILQTEMQIYSLGMDNHHEIVRASSVLNTLKERREQIVARGQRPAIEDSITWRHPES